MFFLFLKKERGINLDAASGYIRTIASETFHGRSDREIIGNEYMGWDQNRNGSREGCGGRINEHGVKGAMN